MKEVSLNDLKRLVETLDSDAPIPEVVEEKEEYPSLIVEAAKEVQENIFKTILQEIQDNEKQIAELKEEVSNIPEAKSYDDELQKLQVEIQGVRSEVSSLNVEEDKTLIEEAVELLPEQTETVSDPLLQAKVDTLSQLQSQQKLLIQRLQTQLATVGGGGETRLEFLDDVDRDSVKVDGKYLQYQSSTGKFIGADASGGGSGVTTALVRDAIQGYYGIETDYYTVGIANTTQEVLAGITSMIMPQVASDRIFQHLPTIMTGVGTNPYVGTGATVGTGQTEFSFAGLSSGASCVVRTALAFTPDEDNTNLDVQLKFTTNTATQSAGTTNFTILKESALIMNEGADQQYITENVFSFPVGTRLEGTTYGNSGSFNIEVIPTSDGTLEVLAVTVSVVA
jgi:hypothetical protein|tara:strand:- start:233 stop:1417 length:1185 start_codon:yes stop_codon:yes gene_type:complete